MGYRIGLDVGGTFTDFSLFNESAANTTYFKVPSTPADPSEAIASGIAQLIELHDVQPSDIVQIGHGTTVATNLVIERKGAKTGLITTKGFRDVLEIGRQTRPHLYDYSIKRPTPLVPRYLRKEVAERVLSDGSVRTPLDEEAVRMAAEDFANAGVEAVAICFLHSYRRPDHEKRAQEIVRAILPDAYISISFDILPEFREFERMSTTILNAYMGPRMGRYLQRLGSRLTQQSIGCGFDTVHSNGGLMSPKTVQEVPVRTCLSGPAAGVMGAAKIGALAGYPNLVTFDVGGTSTDVSVIVDAKPMFASDRLVADYPVKTPMVDIHVIGAGGGSIARVDDAGALKVGPESAGADPGPVAYDRGGQVPTITDANIVLGRLDNTALLNGRLPINAAAARQAIEDNLAKPLGIPTEEAAHGILRIACANMNRAIQSVSTEKGYDVRDFALIAFGGAGPLHAGDLAAESGITTIIIPVEPGTLCAQGILKADISMDFVRSELFIVSPSAWKIVQNTLAEMEVEATHWLEREGVAPERRATRVTIDARYDGQNYEVGVEIEDAQKMTLEAFVDLFRAKHKQEHGYDVDGREVEIVNCRIQAIGKLPGQNQKYVPSASVPQVKGSRSVYFGKTIGWLDANVLDRGTIPVGQIIDGPVIIEEMSSTTIVHPSQKVRVDEWGNLIIKHAA